MILLTLTFYLISSLHFLSVLPSIHFEFHLYILQVNAIERFLYMDEIYGSWTISVIFLITKLASVHKPPSLNPCFPSVKEMCTLFCCQEFCGKFLTSVKKNDPFLYTWILLRWGLVLLTLSWFTKNFDDREFCWELAVVLIASFQCASAVHWLLRQIPDLLI